MKQFNFFQLIIGLAVLAILIVIQTAQVRQTAGDSQLTLLTSQAIIEKGNVDLTQYYDQIPNDQFSSGTWKFRYNNLKKQLEYLYPIGNSIIALPFVYVANALGMNMLIAEHDASLQIFMVSLLAIVLFLLHVRLAKIYVNEPLAVLISIIFTFCTSYISTCATALWSFNSELVWIVLVLIEIAKSEKDETYQFSTWKVGLFLVAAWICRPSAMVFIFFFFLWLGIRIKRLFLKTIGFFSLYLILFVALSYHWYSTSIPFYYNPFMWQNFAKTVSIYEGFLLILFSPNRGLLVYSPFLIFAFFGIFSPARKTILFKILITWFLVYVASLGNLSNWWGGWSFGARLSTDLLPCLFLLSLMGLQNVEIKKLSHSIILIAVSVSAVFGFLINTFQGVYNIETYNWNDYPPIDQHYSFYQWNWQYPQFLASKKNNENKRLDFEWNRMYAKFILQTPENAQILLGVPDASQKNIVDNWNKQKHYGKRYFFNSLRDSLVKDTFYFFRPSHDYVRSFSNTDVLFKSTKELAEFIEENKNKTLILCTKGNWKGNLSEKLKNSLFKSKLNLAQIANYTSYLAVLQNKELIIEKYSETQEVKHDLKIAKHQLALISAPNFASFKLDDKELCINIEGVNILVLNEDLEIEKLGYVDLKLNENYIDLYLYKGTIKKQ